MIQFLKKGNYSELLINDIILIKKQKQNILEGILLIITY